MQGGVNNLPVRENIRRIREAKGITKTFIANALGMSLQGYRYLENGDVRLDVERMKKIASLLCVDSGVLLNDKLTESVIDNVGA